MNSYRTKPDGADLWVVGAAAGAGLAYEILLLRVFAFSQWHHFASLAVSLAMLAFGTAGTTLVLLRRRIIRAGDSFFYGVLVVGSVGMVAASLLPQFLHLRPLFALWDARELAKLLFLDFMSFIPFYALALAIGQVFVRWPEQTARLYAANMGGSGLGALSACLLLSATSLENALLTIPCLLAGVGAVGAFRAHRMLMGGMSASVAALFTWILLAGPPPLPVSDFKALAILKDLPGAEIVREQGGVRSQLSIIRSDGFRSALGLSLNWNKSVPLQDALVLDADRILPMPRNTNAVSLDYLTATLGQIPFILREGGRVAVLGTGGWLGHLRTPGRPVDWVESDGRIVSAFRETVLPSLVTPHVDYPRRFLLRTRNRYSVMFYEYGALRGDAVGEDYALTTEAIHDALMCLESGGILALPMRFEYPPRHIPRLVVLAERALREAECDQPWECCILLRSMREGLLILTKIPFTSEDCLRVREFSDKMGFDIAAMPGLKREEANRFHVLSSPILFDTTRAVFADEGILPPEVAWQYLAPAKDFKPYFWRSMKWRNLPGLWREFGRRALIWLDWSLVMLAIKLIVVTAVAATLILLPLGRLPRGRRKLTRRRICLYYICLGLGFLMLEMAVFQRGTLVLGHPVHAASLVFSVFLIGAGFGSRFMPEDAGPRAVRRIFGPILILSVLTMYLLAMAGRGMLVLSGFWRFFALGAVCLPLAFFLGRPFPWGLRRLDADQPLIPWAWGINGFASVMAAPLSSLLSVQFGQSVTWIAGILCYVVAALIAYGWCDQ